MKFKINFLIISFILIFILCSCGEKNAVSSKTENLKEFKIGQCILKYPESWKSEISDEGNAGTLYIEQDDGFHDNIFMTVSEYDNLLIYYTKEQFEEIYKKKFDDTEITEFDTSSEIEGNYTIVLGGNYTNENIKICFKQYIFINGENTYSFTLSSNEDVMPEELTDVMNNLKF